MITDQTLTDLLNTRTKRLEKFSYALDGGQFGLDSAFGDGLEIDEKRMAVWVPYADGNRRDGVGDLLEVGGIDFSRHRLNPIHLFDHGKHVQLPVGKVEDPETGQYTGMVDVEAKSAKDLVFFWQGKGVIQGVGQERAYDHALFCQQLFALLADKYVRAGSIGYQVKHARPLGEDYDNGTPRGLHLLSVLKLESSSVVLPANGDTVRKMLALPQLCGKPLSPYLVKSLVPYAPEAKAAVVGGFDANFQPNASLKALRRKYRQKAALRTDDRLLDPFRVGDQATFRKLVFLPGSMDVFANVGERVRIVSFRGERPGSMGQATVENRQGIQLEVPLMFLRKSLQTKGNPKEDLLSAFDRLDHGSNFVSLVDLRRSVSLGRQQFDDTLNTLRRERILTMSAAEGRGGITREQQAAMLHEDGTSGLLYVSRRKGLVGDTKTLDVRRKYRAVSQVRRRHRKSVPGVSTVYVRGKDLARLKQEADAKGLKFERAGTKGDLERVKLTGDDGAIDAVAKMFGRVKNLEGTVQTKAYSSPEEFKQRFLSDLQRGGFARYDHYLINFTDPSVKQGMMDLLESGRIEKVKLRRRSDPLAPVINCYVLDGSIHRDWEKVGTWKSFNATGTKAMPTENDATPQTNGDYDYSQEKHGAQLLRRAHEDHSLLMKDYDELMEPLENEHVRKHFESHLGTMEKFLSDSEKVWGKHYKDYPALAGTEDLDGEDKDLTEDEAEDIADDLEAETEDTEEKQVLPEDEAIPADADREEEEPTGDEVLEGMETKSLKGVRRKYKGLNGKAKAITPEEARGPYKVVKSPSNPSQWAIVDSSGQVVEGEDGYNNRELAEAYLRGAQRRGELKALNGKAKTQCECGQDPCICQKSLNGKAKRKDLTEDEADDLVNNIETQTQDTEAKPKGLDMWEKASVGEASGFLGELAQDGSQLDEEGRMKSYHYHKTLDGIASLGEVTQDLNNGESNIPPAEFKPGVGAKGRKSNPGSPEWEQEEMGESPHQDGRKMCKGASGWFKQLSVTRDFGDTHRAKSAHWHKLLKELADTSGGESKPEEAELGDMAGVGEMGEKGLSAFKAKLDKRDQKLDKLMEKLERLQRLAA